MKSLEQSIRKSLVGFELGKKKEPLKKKPNNLDFNIRIPVL